MLNGNCTRISAELSLLGTKTNDNAKTQRCEWVQDSINRAANALISLGRDLGYFKTKPEEFTLSCTNVSFPDHDALQEGELDHNGNVSVISSFNGGLYLLPAKSSFLASDATELQPLLDYVKFTNPFDLVVIDPPWYNKSAKRKGTYSFMSLWQIKSLPLPRLLAPGGLVVVWVTNKAKYIRFTKNELLPSWSVDVLAEWHWLKVTQTGELVVAMDSMHKKPYETLIIGCYNPVTASHQKLQSPETGHGFDATDLSNATDVRHLANHSKDATVLHKSEEDQGDRDVILGNGNASKEGCSCKPIPEHQVICSIPCQKHSRKPPLGEVLAEFLPPNPNCLEMFARNLMPGWTSWGDQVLKFQHISYFDAEAANRPSEATCKEDALS